MSRTSERGFTLVEVLMAVVVLTIGVVALVSSSGLVTRMVGRGRIETMAAQVASERLEYLRQAAYKTATVCTDASFANSTAPQSHYDSKITETWTITNAGSAGLRLVKVAVQYQTPRGLRTDTVSTILNCWSP